MYKSHTHVKNRTELTWGCGAFCGVKPCGVQLRKKWGLRGLPHPNSHKQPREEEDEQKSRFLLGDLATGLWEARCLKRALREPFGFPQPGGQISPRCHSPFSSQHLVLPVQGSLWGAWWDVCGNELRVKVWPHKRLRKLRRAASCRRDRSQIVGASHLARSWWNSGTATIPQDRFNKTKQHTPWGAII